MLFAPRVQTHRILSSVARINSRRVKYRLERNLKFYNDSKRYHKNRLKCNYREKSLAYPLVSREKMEAS